MKKEILKIEKWIKEYVKSAHADGVVVGMSGGKDSLISAKLCADAIGKENVFGVILPNGNMCDLVDAKKHCELLEIKYEILNIKKTYDSILKNTKKVIRPLGKKLSSISTINTAPRVRMTTLYAIAGSLNYLVVNTSNLSEASVGYCTKWGDNAGDFSPLSSFTKTEVCKIGLELNLPHEFVCKTPSDGLSGQSDEAKLGFTYDELDAFIRTGKKGKNFDKISSMHNSSSHKRNGVARYENNLKNFFEK